MPSVSNDPFVICYEDAQGTMALLPFSSPHRTSRRDFAVIAGRPSIASAHSIRTKRENATWPGIRPAVSILCVTIFFSMSFYNAAASAETTPHRVWINDGDGLRNGDFEHWVEGEPVFWNVSPTLKVVLSRKPASTRKGNTALEFSGNCEDCWAATELKFDRPPAGLTLMFTLKARTTAADALRTFIDYGDTNGRSISRQTHPGDGQWHLLEQAITFPQDFSRTRVNVGFTYTNLSENTPWGLLDNAVVRVLPDIQNNRRELIRDTRFRHWNDGVPGGWRVLKGKISRSIETSNETTSLRLEAPGDPDGEGVMLQSPLQLYTMDSGKTLRIQLTTKGPQHVLRHAVFGRVDGKMVSFAYGTGGRKGYAPIPTSEEWSETTTDFLVPENLGSRSASLLMVMNPSATQPVEIQRISATAIPVETQE